MGDFLPQIFGMKIPTNIWVATNQLWVFPKIGVPQNGWFIMENPSFP